jgi:HEAT repeat protein
MPLVRNHAGKPASSDGGKAPPSLNSASSEERWAAARAANSPGSVPSLAEALAGEKDARVREAIFTALATIATRESVLVALPYLRADEAAIRAGALDALRAMPKATQSHMAQLLVDKDPDVRLLACDLAREMGEADGARLLCDLLETDAEANVCAAAVEVVAEIADENALPALSRCASRFPNDPFLTFAIKVASGRLRSRSANPRA